MIASIGNTDAVTMPLRTSTNRPTIAFGDIMSRMSNSTASVSGDTASVSNDAARTATIVQARSELASFDVTYSNVDHSQAEFASHYAEGARLVSLSQGLPQGQYDFTRMSDKQLFVVANDMIVNHDVDPDQIGALTGFIDPDWTGQAGAQTPLFSDTPVNRFAQLKTAADFNSQHGCAAAARFETAAISMMTAMHETAGIAISYDPITRSAGSDTATESIARLNDAIAAFKKEASLTPAQRARRDVLKTMNLTEDAIKAMPPEQREATEEKIAAEVARRLGLGRTSTTQQASNQADTATTDQLPLIT